MQIEKIKVRLTSTGQEIEVVVFSKRAEAGTGVVRAVITAASGTGAPSEGSLLRIVFKALAPSDGTRVTLTENVRAMAPTGEAVLLASPGEWVVRVK